MTKLNLPILALTVLLLVPSPASGQDQDTRWVRQILRQQYWSCDSWTDTCERRYRYVRVRRYVAPVYSYVQREHDHDRAGRRCRDKLRVVGDQHLTVDGARGQADKAWAQTVRYYHGEMFMSLEHARGVAYTCTRSSVGETLGQVFNRCEIEAKPCQPSKQEAVR